MPLKTGDAAFFVAGDPKVFYKFALTRLDFKRHSAVGDKSPTEYETAGLPATLHNGATVRSVAGEIYYTDPDNPFLASAYDYPTYFETGNTRKAMEVAVANPIVKRMYEAPFKAYMMDEFMKYFGVDEWKTAYPLDPENRKNVQPRWMRQMGTLMVNHGIEKDGHKCEACHESKVYGPPGSIYTRKDRKVTSWAKLKAQVAAALEDVFA